MIQVIPYFIYIFFSIAPSIIWLLLYLRKDVNPEPNRMIIKIFFYGMMATLPIISFYAIAQALGFIESFENFFTLSIFHKILYIFFVVALIEELLKYLVVKGKVLKNSEMDEPTDIVIYMIIAALGFAALENLLYLLPTLTSIENFSIKETILFSIIRFVGATFLHALCSGIFGYFLALSIYKIKKRKIIMLTGLFLATFLHGLYNFFIMEAKDKSYLIIPLIILVGLAIGLAFAFNSLKKMKSVCKIN